MLVIVAIGSFKPTPKPAEVHAQSAATETKVAVPVPVEKPAAMETKAAVRFKPVEKPAAHPAQLGPKEIPLCVGNCR